MEKEIVIYPAESVGDLEALLNLLAEILIEIACEPVAESVAA
jgi:hypothetical protein